THDARVEPPMARVDEHGLPGAGPRRREAQAGPRFEGRKQDAIRNGRRLWRWIELYSGGDHYSVRAEQADRSEGERNQQRENERYAKQGRRAPPAPSAVWDVASVCDRPGNSSGSDATCRLFDAAVFRQGGFLGGGRVDVEDREDDH